MSENKKETKNQDMIEKEMKEKMKQTVEDEKIPSSLEPEAVEKMLETRKKKKLEYAVEIMPQWQQRLALFL